MNEQPTFVDTWGWGALGSPRDGAHREVTNVFRTLRTAGVPIVTSDFVLDELITLLFRREPYDRAVRFVEKLLGAADTGHMTIERVTPQRSFSAAWALRKRFHDKPTISFTDLCSMGLMSEREIRHVITDDDHFLHVGMGFHKLP